MGNYVLDTLRSRTRFRIRNLAGTAAIYDLSQIFKRFRDFVGRTNKKEPCCEPNEIIHKTILTNSMF
jgi:hypothetical protein